MRLTMVQSRQTVVEILQYRISEWTLRPFSESHIIWFTNRNLRLVPMTPYSFDIVFRSNLCIRYIFKWKSWIKMWSWSRVFPEKPIIMGRTIHLGMAHMPQSEFRWNLVVSFGGFCRNTRMWNRTILPVYRGGKMERIFFMYFRACEFSLWINLVLLTYLLSHLTQNTLLT